MTSPYSRGLTAQNALLIHWLELEKLVSVEVAPSDPLRGESTYPQLLMVLGLIESRFDET